jgi:hypothetical protein
LTWLYLDGTIVSQGRVNVYCYDGDVLVAETISDRNGSYLLQGILPGTYTVIGELVADPVLYTDVALDVDVVHGETTPLVDIVLAPM